MKKMFNIIRMTLVLALLVMVSSCLKVDIVLPEQETSNVSLSFISRDIAQTRAEAGEQAGVGIENVVESIDVFFYSVDATDDDVDALHKMRIEKDKLTSKDNINYSYTASIPTADINTIFGKKTTCKIYAIANISAETEFKGTSINALKATTLNTDFSQSQKSFVMSGESSNITFDSSERKISGSVNLYRSASKIELIIKQVQDIPVTDEYGNQKIDSDGKLVVWNADTENMIVTLQKGVKTSYIDGYCELSAEKDYFNTNDVTLVKVGENGWKHATPFYTYPSNWEKESAIETNLKLIVPWSKSDAPGVYYNTYYTIPISETGLVRNTYYKIELTVGRLGTFDEGEDVVLTPASYYIYDWSTNTIRTELLDYRYLVVNQKEYTIYNQEELYIPFSSSHETEIVSVEFKQQDLSNKYASAETWNEITKGSAKYYNALDIKDGQIYYKNDLDNVYISNTFDFTPYKLTFRIRHKETQYQGVYYEDITVIQYPAIYGVPYTNSDWENSNSPGDNANNDKNGYVFVNGYNGDISRGTQDFFCAANGFTNTSGSPNMFVFNITSVAGTDYVVGDPRENVIDENFINQTHNQNNRTYSIWDTAPALYDGETDRTLRYYYATDVDYTSSETMQNSRTRNMIAPQFRIASAYAVLSTNVEEARKLEYLKKRCASYQEDGYPAGRWRLPTEAEFRFIISQVNKTPATLPPLYITNTDYWCAHGVGTVNGATVTMTYTTEHSYIDNRTTYGHSTRCVYDTWYWGNEPIGDPSVFTWGDQPR